VEQVAPNLIGATDDLREIIPISHSPRSGPVELPNTSLTKHVNGTGVVGIGADQVTVPVNGVGIASEAPHLIPVANIRTMTGGVQGVECHPERDEAEEDIATIDIPASSEGVPCPDDLGKLHGEASVRAD
jgi:hypothetical protein